jgi:hypothetical protein
VGAPFSPAQFKTGSKEPSPALCSWDGCVCEPKGRFEPLCLVGLNRVRPSVRPGLRSVCWTVVKQVPPTPDIATHRKVDFPGFRPRESPGPGGPFELLSASTNFIIAPSPPASESSPPQHPNALRYSVRVFDRAISRTVLVTMIGAAFDCKPAILLGGSVGPVGPVGDCGTRRVSVCVWV